MSIRQTSGVFEPHWISFDIRKEAGVYKGLSDRVRSTTSISILFYFIRRVGLPPICTFPFHLSLVFQYPCHSHRFGYRSSSKPSLVVPLVGTSCTYRFLCDIYYRVLVPQRHFFFLSEIFTILRLFTSRPRATHSTTVERDACTDE